MTGTHAQNEYLALSKNLHDVIIVTEFSRALTRIVAFVESTHFLSKSQSINLLLASLNNTVGAGPRANRIGRKDTVEHHFSSDKRAYYWANTDAHT